MPTEEKRENIQWQVRPVLGLLLIFSLLTGLVYPLVITAISQLFFSKQANGSLLYDNSGKIVGSELIGQAFHSPKYFWSRPSATAGFSYNSFDAQRRSGSSGSNWGSLHPDFLQSIQQREKSLRLAAPENTTAVPVDLVTASASGLDPHISPAAAYFQVQRVAKVRGLDTAKVRYLVEQHIEARRFGILGEPVVNVLLLNLALDSLH